MQIILVSRHLKAARTITIMPRHLVMVVAAFLTAVFFTSAAFSWLSVHLRLPEHQTYAVVTDTASK